MYKRPKRGEDEEDILRMQEEFFQEIKKNAHVELAAKVTNLGESIEIKIKGKRQRSKYAISKGLTGNFGTTSTSEGGKYDKDIDDDKVYYPKVMPFIVGDIVEKNVDCAVSDVSPMPTPSGFPATITRDSNTAPTSGSIFSLYLEKQRISQIDNAMEIDKEQKSTVSTSENINSLNLPSKSYIVSSDEADSIHKQNVETISKMSEKEVLEEQQKLISILDPTVIQFLKSKRSPSVPSGPNGNRHVDNSHEDTKHRDIATDAGDEHIKDRSSDAGSYWDNDVFTHPHIDKWLHFDSIEEEKLEWMKDVEECKKINPNEPYEARFDFKGCIMPYITDYSEKTKILFHHSAEPQRPGYSLAELFELSRSSLVQQRALALNTIAHILAKYTTGTYHEILELPLTKVFFVLRFSLDENKAIILEPTLEALNNLLYNRVDEACLDALIGFEEGMRLPSLEKCKLEIAELQANESELSDYHLAEIDLISASLRTDIVQRIYYILDVIRPSVNCVQYCLQILSRLIRDSPETAQKVIQSEHLMNTIFKHFIPRCIVNIKFEPHVVYNGKPILAALKFVRILSSQSKEISEVLNNKYDIALLLSEYVNSNFVGSYELRIQIESYCILTNLVYYGVAIDRVIALFPIILTCLCSHIQNIDVAKKSTSISVIHATIILHLLNKVMNTHYTYSDDYKYKMYYLINEGILKWSRQALSAESYTDNLFRLISAGMVCFKTIIEIEHNIDSTDLLNILRISPSTEAFKRMVKCVLTSSNLLSGVETKQIHSMNNIVTLGSCVILSNRELLPVLKLDSPMLFLTSLFKLLESLNDRVLSTIYVDQFYDYFSQLNDGTLSLTDNWFTKIEMNFLFSLIKVAILQGNIMESKRGLLYAVANKLCYLLRVDQQYELEFLFANIVFNKNWFAADRLINVLAISNTELFPKTLTSIEDIKQCYAHIVYSSSAVVNASRSTSAVIKNWQEPILPRDWIYLPILKLYSESNVNISKINNDSSSTNNKEVILALTVEWILFNELCFPELLNDIDLTDKFCRIMCIFLCDNSLFLHDKIKASLRMCITTLFKYEKSNCFNFNKDLVGLSNFQDFYTQFLEHFQSVSYGDPSFVACVLVPLAQRHDVKWRKIIWSEYACCVRALDCPEELLCYDISEYLYPQENDESLIKCYLRALSDNLLRPGTIAHRIASHHVKFYQNYINKT